MTSAVNERRVCQVWTRVFFRCRRLHISWNKIQNLWCVS